MDKKEKAKGIVKEFKEFISRGNVIDMAVGVIIGAAFGKIVSSLVDDILMPLIGAIIGGLDFTSLTVKIGDATVCYGNFIQNIVDFLIVALCILCLFVMMKALNKFKKKEEPKEEAPKTPEDVLLLREIRNLLKEKKK